MASDGEACCESDPNFAVICGFLEKFGVTCGLANIDFVGLQDMLENNQEVAQELIDLHVKLLRKARKSVSSERWERAIIKFCHSFCSQDAWEIERFGYKKARLSSKLRILKELLEIQFDYNTKFKNEVNKLSADELRTQPLGRDRLGHIYWFQSDNSCQIRVYKEDLDEETWALVAKNRDDLVSLITQLNDGKETLVNEDSNSLESEKPVVDTGQTDSSSSKSDLPTESPLNGTNIVTVETISPKEEIKEETKVEEPNDLKDNPEANGVKSEGDEKEEQVLHNPEETKEEQVEHNPEEEQVKHNPEEEKEEKVRHNPEEVTESTPTSDNKEEEPQDLTTKPESESTVTEPKKEVLGIKEKYIRSDSISSSVSHTKAVDSAGFNVRTSYLKRPPHDEENVEEEEQEVKDLSCVKRPRLDRPTLLGNKKRKFYSDDDDDDYEEDEEEETDEQEPSLTSDENTSPIIGEAIEEPVMHVTGEGTGVDCETGNEQVQASVNQPDENSSAAHTTNQVQPAETAENLKVLSRDQENGGQTQTDVLCNSDNEKEESESEKEDQSTKKSMFFFGPGSLQVKPTISPKKKNEDEESSDTINNKTEETTEIEEDLSRKLVLNRRKSDKPTRKSSGSDLDDKKVEEKEVQSSINNLLSSPNNVPKNISNSDTKDDSSKNFDIKHVDVPLINKTDCSSTTNSDKGGLPIQKNAIADKPKSKLDNVLEKINQGKLINKKTDGLDLDKHKNNNLTLTETKVSSLPVLKSEEASIKNSKLPKEEDIPKLEDSSVVNLQLQRNNMDLSPPSLEREVLDDEVQQNNSHKNSLDEHKPKDLKSKSNKARIETESTDTEKTEETVVGRRVTRRTRSNADKSSDGANDKDSGDVDEVKTKSKLRKKSDCPKIDKDLEALATNRELRERKPTTTISKEKPKSKLQKNKKDAVVNNKERKHSNRFKEESAKEVNPEEIEEKIVIKVDSRSTKKLKLTEDKVRQEKNDEKLLIPVDEPKCIKKIVSLLTDEDVEKKTDKVATDDDTSNDIILVPEVDPLASPEREDDDSKPAKPVMTLASFAIDVDDDDDAVVPARVTRKRAAQQSVDTLRESTNLQKKTISGKKRKLKRKRSTEQKLRKAAEAKKSKDISTSDEDQEPKSNSENQESSYSKSPSSDNESKTIPKEPKEKKPRQIRKTLLGLEISEVTENMLKQDSPMGVRQSRRIAQLKIREEAERRKMEELTLHDLKEEKVRKGKKDVDKDYKLEKKKKKAVTEDESTGGDGEFEEKKKRKRKKKHGDPRKQFDVHNPWKSSSGSSSSSVEEEEEEIEEDDDHPMVLKSDHEFSPESDLEEGAETQPLKRARTAKKESDPEEEIDDYACQKCGQSDHPECILLCDSCDSGWHCSCLRPALLVIPEGDWFCPPCQHVTLLKNLEVQLVDYDKKLNKKVMENRRKERLAYVGISLDNVLPSKEFEDYRSKNRQIKRRDDDDDDDDDDEDVRTDESDSDESSSESESGTTTDSESEPIYQLRKRRQAHSYRFNDYDELINSAIQDEMDAVKGAGNQGRGKDISTIVNAEKQETETLQTGDPVVDQPVLSDVPTDLTVKNNPVENAEPALEPLPPVVPPDYDKKAEESEEEIIRPVRRIISKKKHRKLNSLDVSSGDDAESDEDFKGSSSSDSEEDDYAGSESSDDLDVRKGRRYKDYAPIRRSTRARISRYDRDFINDDSDSESAARRKKNRSTWDESESEESDRSWGRRKRRAAAAKSRRKQPTDKPRRPKKKKKKRTGEESDPEVFRKRPNIKFGGLNDDEEVGRRTRGKKINYLEALGTDSDDDVRRKPPRIEESDDEYAVHEDEDLQQRLANDNDSDESGVENVLRDLPLPLNPKPKSKGRGKAGLKIPRKPKDQPSLDLFAPLMPDLAMPTEGHLLQQPLECQTMMGQQMVAAPLLLGSSIIPGDPQGLDDEPNPIEEINKNVEQMNEQEMEKMMEEEDYANRQLQLVALQIEKEKKRKERERLDKLTKAALLQQQAEPKIPKKRGRKPKNQAFITESATLISNNAELSEPPGVALPMFNEIAPNLDGSPKKRREAESPLHGSKLGIAAPPQPFSQSQPTPSVITRMLQSQPGQGNFNPSAISKYFSGSPNDPQLAPFHPGVAGPRGPFQQPGPDISHFPVIRSGPPPVRLHSPGTPALPPMYHRPLDPSPSGGGSINVPRDRQSPAVVSPSSNSPLSKGDPTPPPYARPPFPPGSANSTTGGTPRQLPIHLQQQHRATNISPFHPSVPPNYHYGPYPPPPINAEDGGQPPPNYPAPFPEQYPEGGAPAPPVDGGAGGGTVSAKAFEEGDEGGEFVGLVSYFSSQREDDLDT